MDKTTTRHADSDEDCYRCSDALEVRIAEAARRIRTGRAVAFPTETVYGLGANAYDASAVAKIYALKGRPSDNPLIVHVSDKDMLSEVAAYVPDEAQLLMDRYWPGPLTIVLDKSAYIPSNVSSLSTVGVRMPSHVIALELIRQAGVPIAAPSANKSGRPSPTSAQHVYDDFSDAVETGELQILDGGSSPRGLESTVVALHGTPLVLRQGAVSLEELQQDIPGIVLAHGHAGAMPESPGMKHRHYRPKQPLALFSPGAVTELLDAAAYERRCGREPVILCDDAHAAHFPGYRVLSFGENYADLFAALRTPYGDTLLALGVLKNGLGRTVMDRLERAATTTIGY